MVRQYALIGATAVPNPHLCQFPALHRDAWWQFVSNSDKMSWAAFTFYILHYELCIMHYALWIKKKPYRWCDENSEWYDLSARFLCNLPAPVKELPEGAARHWITKRSRFSDVIDESPSLIDTAVCAFRLLAEYIFQWTMPSGFPESESKGKRYVHCRQIFLHEKRP